MAAEVTITKQLIRGILLADTALRQRVDGKILPTHLATAEDATVLRDKPIVIVETRSGYARYFSNLQDVIFDIWVYSKNSSDECAAVYDMVFPLLQQTRLTVPNVDMKGIAREIERPDVGWNEVVHAWYCKGRWTMKTVN